MTSLEESRLDSVLRRGLRGIEGLPESARSADQSITRYLKQKLGELMVSDYKKKSKRNVDGTVVAGMATQMLDEVVLDAQRLYELFELHMKNQLDGPWKELDLEGKMEGVLSAGSRSDAASSGFYPVGAVHPSIGGRRFLCQEGCELEGDDAYLAHRDRGHHPVPA